MSVEITLASEESLLLAIEKLAFKIWHQHYTPIIGQKQVEYMLSKYQCFSAMQQQISDGYRYYAITNASNVEQSIIGYFAVQPRSNSLFLSKLYLDASSRGKGLSRLALSYIEQLANKEKLPEIELTVNKYNTGAIDAYKTMGFTVKEEAVFDIGKGFVMDDYVMVRQL